MKGGGANVLEEMAIITEYTRKQLTPWHGLGLEVINERHDKGGCRRYALEGHSE